MYSNWEDREEKSLENLINKILKVAKDKVVEKDPVDNSDLLYEVEVVFEKNQTFTVNGRDVTYNYITYRYETVKRINKFDDSRDKRISLYEVGVIVYTYNNKIYYIVNKGYTPSTLKNLRKLLNYVGQGEIVEKWTLGIKTDLFIWMIHYILDFPDNFLDEQETTKILSVVGFKGERSDKLAEINGSGEKIMEMLTTLVFLFENKNISKVETTMLRSGERYKLSLGTKLLEIDINSYVGKNFLGIREEVISKVAITIFVDLLPNLVNLYSAEQESKIWSDKKEELFFKDIGKNITKTIKEKLSQKKK